MENELILRLNLQFFAKDGPGGEKTEPATSKKLNDIRKEGQVAKSKEIITAISLMSLFIILKVYLSSLGTGLIDVYKEIYSSVPLVISESASGLQTRMATRRIIRIMAAGIIKIMLAESHLNSRDLI